MDSAEVTVNVIPLPLADAGPDTTICEGASIVIGGSPTGPPGGTAKWHANPVVAEGYLDFDTLHNPRVTAPTGSSGTVDYFVSCYRSDYRLSVAA